MKNITITFTNEEAIQLVALLLAMFIDLKIKLADQKTTDEIKALMDKVTSALHDKKTNENRINTPRRRGPAVPRYGTDGR